MVKRIYDTVDIDVTNIINKNYYSLWCNGC